MVIPGLGVDRTKTGPKVRAVYCGNQDSTL